MTIYSGTVESTKFPGRIRHFRYMKFLKENEIKRLFYLYVSKIPTKYDIIKEFKKDPITLYMAANLLPFGLEVLAIYDDRDNKDLGILATIGSTDMEADTILKEFIRITRVKEGDVPLEELEKEVMRNIEFYKSLI